MAVSLKTQKILWGKAAGRCAMPDCRRDLVESIEETDDQTLVGENCHIVAEHDGGPRSNPFMSVEQRSRYENLILLCRIHHRIIDDNELIWPVDRLHALKKEHESWVDSSLGIDRAKLHDEALYCDYIDEWARLAHLDEWTAWSSWVLGAGHPCIWVRVDDDLQTLRRWFLTRVWPGRYPALEHAFYNFHSVIEDFQQTLHRHLVHLPGDYMRTTEKFYLMRKWDPPLYEQLSAEYDFHVDIVGDLMLELTRATNYLCDQVRCHVSRGFRLAEGYVTVHRGPDINFSWSEFAPRYSFDEVQYLPPYRGLSSFYDDRNSRDWSIGRGQPKIKA